MIQSINTTVHFGTERIIELINIHRKNPVGNIFKLSTSLF